MGARRRLVARAVGCGLWVVGVAVAQDHVGQPVPQYTTGEECLFCHRVKVADTWQQNPHARTIRVDDDGNYFIGAKPEHARALKKNGYGKYSIQKAGKSGWEDDKFPLKCAGCHTTAVDPETHAFGEPSLDCYTCHGIADLNHSSNTALMWLSAKHPRDPKLVTSICAQCHLRGGRSKSSGLPYANNFVAGDNLFADFQFDPKEAGNPDLNPGDRHVYASVRDVLENGSAVTCINCHQVHGDSSAKHRRVLTGPICLNCHNADGPKSAVKKFAVHSTTCEY
jgi:hypothetical protein